MTANYSYESARSDAETRISAGYAEATQRHEQEREARLTAERAASFSPNSEYEHLLALKASDPSTYESVMNPSLRMALGSYAAEKRASESTR